MSNKRVLVAGGSGFVATNLILALLKKGHQVRTTVHERKPQVYHPEVEYVSADLTQKSDCYKAMKDMEWVFMCAANTSGAGIIATLPMIHVTSNWIMNALILEAAYRAGVEKFLWISSNTVYPATQHPVREDEVYSGPLFEKYFFVGTMKRATENLCEMYWKLDRPMPTIVVRPANIYGPYDDFEWETSHVVPALVRKVVEDHDPIEVWGDGNDIKDLIYVEDFVEGILLAMEKIKKFDPINIGTGVPVTIKDVLAMTLELEDCTRTNVVFNTTKPTMIPKRLIDVSKAERELGFEAKTSLKDGLRKTIQWYRIVTNRMR